MGTLMATATRKCCGCKTRYQQSLDTWRQSPVGYFHDNDCQIAYAIRTRDNKRAKVKAAEWKVKKAEVKGLKYWLKVTQPIVNKYARLRDSNKPCISCGKYQHELSTSALHGSVWDGGHYRSVGSNCSLRFDLRNINGQCADCNRFKGGRKGDQKARIVERYGQARLDWLDGNHDAKNYTIQHLERMRKLINKRMKRYGRD